MTAKATIPDRSDVGPDTPLRLTPDQQRIIGDLIDAARQVMHHDADETSDAWKWEMQQLTERFATILFKSPQKRRRGATLITATKWQRDFLARFIQRGWLHATRTDPDEQEAVEIGLHNRWLRHELGEAHFTPAGRAAITGQGR